MISLISFIIVLVGAFNWMCIGILQYDFIAGLFGSQANLFSRIVYAIVGFAALWLIYATIKQRGKIFVNGKKENDEKLLGKLKDRLTKTKPEDKPKNQPVEAVAKERTPESKSQPEGDQPHDPVTMEERDRAEVVGMQADDGSIMDEYNDKI